MLINIDPNSQYSDLSDDDILETCGLLPYWVANENFSGVPLKEALTVQYGFGELREMTGGTLSDSGVYSYPEDPDLHPLMVIERGDETFYQFEYAIVAFKQQDGSVFVTRMD